MGLRRRRRFFGCDPPSTDALLSWPGSVGPQGRRRLRVCGRAACLDPEAATVRWVVAGVDTHDLTHHAAVLDGLGRELGDQQFPATAAGYTALLGWVRDHGQLVTVGVEGTGSYGAGLTRHLHAAGVNVVEIVPTASTCPPGPCLAPLPLLPQARDSRALSAPGRHRPAGHTSTSG